MLVDDSLATNDNSDSVALVVDAHFRTTSAFCAPVPLDHLNDAPLRIIGTVGTTKVASPREQVSTGGNETSRD